MKIINKSYVLFILLSLITLLLVKIASYLLNIDALNYKNLLLEHSIEQTERILNIQKKIEWIYYLVIPIMIILKTITIATVIYIGISLFNIRNISFNSICKIILKAELILILAIVAKIFWFYFFETNYTIEDIQNFYPLSALNILGYKGLESWFIYPFQVLNLFELFYIIYLGYEIGRLTNTDYGLKIISASYVPSLLLWVAIVMFLTLNYS